MNGFGKNESNIIFRLMPISFIFPTLSNRNKSNKTILQEKKL